MVEKRINLQRGFSVIEVLVVIVIISILVVFSVAQFGNAETQFQSQKIARELKNNLERARFDSVKRRPYTIDTMSRVVINSPTSFSLINDLNQNGVLDSSDARTVDFSGSDIKIVTNGVSFPITVRFDRRGKIAARDSLDKEVDAEFVVCDNCTYATAKTSDYSVTVSLTGTITMLKFGDSLQTFLNPTTTTVGTGTGINELVTNKTSGGTTSPPSSTPTPPASTPTPPNSTPTPPASTPTPPSSTPTPAPTPQQNICKHNEKPANTGCKCQSPMTLFKSGQCKS